MGREYKRLFLRYVSFDLVFSVALFAISHFAAGVEIANRTVVAFLIYTAGRIAHCVFSTVKMYMEINEIEDERAKRNNRRDKE